jgi:uncharacterized short protein YbdD (DUF466 family)
LNLKKAVDAIVWYLREVSGEVDYDRYVTHARRNHDDAPVLSRRDFERRRARERDERPSARCC